MIRQKWAFCSENCRGNYIKYKCDCHLGCILQEGTKSTAMLRRLSNFLSSFNKTWKCDQSLRSLCEQIFTPNEILIKGENYPVNFLSFTCCQLFYCEEGSSTILATLQFSWFFFAKHNPFDHKKTGTSRSMKSVLNSVDV